jgi:hypothetical protein
VAAVEVRGRHSCDEELRAEGGGDG